VIPTEFKSFNADTIDSSTKEDADVLVLASIPKMMIIKSGSKI
jgi:hypothetical protein